MKIKENAMQTDLSIIIPVLNEAGQIQVAIDRLCAQNFDGRLQIIVVDGDAGGSTIKSLENEDQITCLVSKPGRAHQMNKGAQASQGQNLCFLHCDTILPDDALNTIKTTLANPAIDVGAFDLSIDAKGITFRIIEKTASCRSRLTKIPYGDQAIFLGRFLFFDLGQFPEIPLMEDVAFMQQVKKQHGRLCILKSPVLTSARRWQQEGRLYTTLRNWTIRILYALGVSPHKLVRVYKNHKPGQ